MNGWFIEEFGFDSGQGRVNFFQIASSLSLSLSLNQPPVYGVLGPVSHFVMSPQPGIKEKYAVNHTSCPHVFSYCDA